MEPEGRLSLRQTMAKLVGGGPAVGRGCLLLMSLLMLLAGCGQAPTGPALSRTESSPSIAPASSLPSDPLHCTRGRIVGLWIKNQGSEFDGHIEAAWIGARGDTLGMVYGTFWMDSVDGACRFVATVSGQALPVILYELSGAWRFNDPRMCPLCGTGQGLFSGRWSDPRTGRQGRLSGDWGDMSLPFPERKMPLSGTWNAPCRRADELRLVNKPY